MDRTIFPITDRIIFPISEDLKFGLIKIKNIKNDPNLLNFVNKEEEIFNNLDPYKEKEDESKFEFMLTIQEAASYLHRHCKNKENTYLAYIKDYTDKIIMTMCVYYDHNFRDESTGSCFQYHIGIHRNLEDLLSTYRSPYKNISIALHICACKAINIVFNSDEKRYVLIDPLEKMNDILTKYFRKNNIGFYSVSTEYNKGGFNIISVVTASGDVAEFRIDETNRCVPGASVGFLANDVVRLYLFR